MGTDDEFYNTETELDSDNPDYGVNPPIWSLNTAGIRPIPFLKVERLLVSQPTEDKPINYFNLVGIFRKHHKND